MSVARTQADRVGLTLSVILACVLVALVAMNGRAGATDSVDSAAAAVNLEVAQVASEPAVPLPTTEAIELPDAEVELVASTVGVAVLQTATDGLGDDLADESGSGASLASIAEPVAVAGSTETTEPAEPDEPAAAALQSAAPDTPAASAAPAVPNPQPQPTSAVPNPQLPEAPAAANPQVPAAAVATPADAPSGGTFTRSLTAVVARPSLHTAPGGPQFTPTFNGVALPAVNPTVFGNPLVYRVLAGEPGDVWAKVYVPARPNGTTAWVQASQFTWGSSNRLLQINVTDRSVTVFEGSNVLLTSSAVLGGSSSPTPLAEGWVEETMAGPSSAYGPLLISLGIFSDALNTFAGSIPKIALHGTNNPSLMGQYASNGCIRVPNDIITQVANLMPAGSKVQIVG